MQNTPKSTPKKNQPFNFPMEAAESVGSINTIPSGLPVEAYVFYIKNGSQQAKRIGGVEYTGGLASSSLPDANLVIEDVFGIQHDLTDRLGTQIVENINSQGQPYDTIEFSRVKVAPVVSRKRWAEGRTHIQVVCLMDLFGDGEVVIWSTISARGFQSSILADQLGYAATLSKSQRRDLGGPPINFFWHIVGMPDNPEFKQVGKVNTATITPVKAMLATEEVRDSYIGNELAKIIGEFSAMEEVKEWRDAWKEEQKQLQQNFNTSFEQQNTNTGDIPF